MKINDRHVIITAVVCALSASLMTACSPSAEDIEERQKISKLNGEFNIKKFSRTIDDVVGVEIQSDSTIGKDGCAYGDGWATGELEMVDGSRQEAKCQTNGSGKGIEGCLLTVDFNKKANYAEQEGSCDASIKSLKLLDE